jgi:glycine betaine/proline transport system substrate-binding protein
VAAAAVPALTEAEVQGLIGQAVETASDSLEQQIASSAASASTDEESKGTVKIARFGWDSNDLELNLFTKILENEMGYSVEPISISSLNAYVALSRGDVDVAVEMWGSEAGLRNQVQEFITEKGLVEFIGPLGAIGENAWYVPRYVIEGDVARGITAVAPDLVSVSQLNQYKDVFASVETAPQGRLSAVVPGWANNEERIPGLGLDYVITYTGSEAGQLAELEGAIRKGEPLLFYFWEPHFVHRKFDLVKLEMPPFTAECYESNYACSPPLDTIKIGAWVEFKDNLPEAYQFFQNAELTNDDLAEMLFKFDAGSSFDEAVQSWMDRHQDRWRSWIPGS